jgi:hypothetical protein
MVKLQSPLPNSICFRMLQRTLPAGFIAPCLPTKTDKLPSGSDWLHEIKHDGFRVIARKKSTRVRLYRSSFPSFQPTINSVTSNRNRFVSRSLKRDLCGVSASGIRNHHGPLIAAGARKNEKLNTV